MSKKVSAIVCAYNEQKTIGAIVKVLVNHPKLYEVIVVDDGSSDKTWDVIFRMKDKKLVLIRHRKNKGKGAAMVSGVRKSKGEVLLFVDSDITKFHSNHVDIMLNPIEINEKVMVIGNHESRYKYSGIMTYMWRTLNGQRVLLKKYFLPALSRIENSGYGAETILNLRFMRGGKKIVYVPLVGLRHLTKMDKHSFYKFMTDYFGEGADILKQYVSPDNKSLKRFYKKILKHLSI